MGSAKLRVRRTKHDGWTGRRGWEITLYGKVVATVGWSAFEMNKVWYWWAPALPAYAMPLRNTANESLFYSDDEAARRDAFAYVSGHVAPMHVALTVTQSQALCTIAWLGVGEAQRRQGGFWTYQHARTDPVTGTPEWWTGSTTIWRLRKVGLLTTRCVVSNHPDAASLTDVGKLRAVALMLKAGQTATVTP